MKVLHQKQQNKLPPAQAVISLEELYAMQAEIRDNFQDALNDGALHLLASSSGTDEENAAWVEEIKEAFPGVPLLYDNLSLGVSCHIGPGGMGIGCAVAPDYKRV